jgi:hypothetical protein
VSSQDNKTRRAVRLLRWYPIAWREQYGDEFVDHLEQEFADRPVDLRRAINVVYKGFAARIADIGLSNGDGLAKGRTRAAVGTSFVLTALMAMLALNFWSMAMGLWGGRRYHPVPDTVVTGILTVAIGLLLVILAVIVVTVAVCVVRQIMRGRARPLVVPSIFALGAGGLLLYDVRWLPRMLVQYAHGTEPLRPNPTLSQPVRVIDELARITWMLTQRWVAPWSQNASNTPTVQTVVNYLVPLAVLIFGISIALLMRRVELPHIGERLGPATVALQGALTASFFVAYAVWFMVGGPSGGTAFWMGPQAGGAYLVFLAIVAVLIGRLGILARRTRA